MKLITTMALAAALFSTNLAHAQHKMGGRGHGVNPSSVLCTQKGGKTVTSEEAATEENVSFCKIGKAYIGEWTLFKQLHGDKTLAVKALLSGKVFTPKVKPGHGKIIPFPIYNCKEHGGTYVRLKESSTNSPTAAGGLCRFKDDSTIEVGTLYGSTDDKDNAKLLSVLGK